MDESQNEAPVSPGSTDYSAELTGAVLAALPAWVEATMRRVLGATHGIDDGTLRAEIAAASATMVQGVRTALGDLFALDPEEQRANPLHILRAEATVVTECLGRLGARPAVRDEFERTSLPDDVFAVGPLAWRDLGDEVHEAGITWGAWKAATIMARHRTEGRGR